MARPVEDTTWAWFLAACGGVFGVLEVWAYRRHERTLTRALQRWLGLQPRRPWGVITPWAVCLGWMWLTAHLIELRIRELVRSRHPQPRS